MTPWYDPPRGISCSAVLIKVSMSGLGARTNKQPFATPASSQHKRNRT